MTLTDAAYWSRAFIKYGALFMVFLIVARIVVGIGINIYQSFFPPAPPPPTVAFGKLPALIFPYEATQVDARNYTFILELPEGDLPVTPLSLPVFVIPQRSPFLGALDQARQIASRLRFSDSEEELSPSIYRFTNTTTGATLDMNIITGAFSINSQLYKDPQVLSQLPPNEERTVSAVQSYLAGAGVLPDDLSQGSSSVIFVKAEQDTLVPVLSLSDGNFTRVGLFRRAYSPTQAPSAPTSSPTTTEVTYPVVTPIPGQPNVWFLVSGTTDSVRQIIGGEYHFFHVDYEQSSTYPVKTASQAWEELKMGKGALMFAPVGINTIVIRRVYLAYYDSPQFQQFFQPLFVFEGDNSVRGYVPAVTAEYYSQ